MTQVKNGDRFYDELNCRYLTVDGFGCDPNVCSCVVEESYDVDENGDPIGTLEITGRQLFHKNELLHFKRL